MSDWKTGLKRRVCCGIGVNTLGISCCLTLEFLRGAISNWLGFNNNEFYAYFTLVVMIVVSYTSFHLFSEAYHRGTAWGLKLIRYGWPFTFFVFFTNPSNHVGPVFFTLTAIVVLALWRVSYLCLSCVLAGFDKQRD